MPVADTQHLFKLLNVPLLLVDLYGYSHLSRPYMKYWFRILLEVKCIPDKYVHCWSIANPAQVLWYCLSTISMSFPSTANILMFSRNVLVTCCRIWSWSPMPCEKHDLRDSVDKNRDRRRGIFFVTEARGPCVSHGMEDQDQMLLQHVRWLIFSVLFTLMWILVL